MNFTGERVVPGQMHRYITTLQEHMARYNLALKPALGKRVLDAACGAGYGSKLLTEAAKSVTGVDRSIEAVSFALENYPTRVRSSRELSFKICNLEKDFPVGQYDLCVSFETIEHLDDPARFLTNVAKKCKEFIFSIPLNNPSAFHRTVWTKEGVVEMMNKYWGEIAWYNQSEINFYPGIDNATFIVGYATKSKLK